MSQSSESQNMQRVADAMETFLLTHGKTPAHLMERVAAVYINDTLGMWPRSVYYDERFKVLSVDVSFDSLNVVSISRSVEQAQTVSDIRKDFARQANAILLDALLETANRTWAATRRIIIKRFTDRLMKPHNIYYRQEGQMIGVELPTPQGNMLGIGMSLDQAQMMKDAHMKFANATPEQRKAEIISRMDAVITTDGGAKGTAAWMEHIRTKTYDSIAAYIPTNYGLRVTAEAENADDGVVVVARITDDDDSSVSIRRTFIEAFMANRKIGVKASVVAAIDEAFDSVPRPQVIDEHWQHNLRLALHEKLAVIPNLVGLNVEGDFMNHPTRGVQYGFDDYVVRVSVSTASVGFTITRTYKEFLEAAREKMEKEATAEAIEAYKETSKEKVVVEQTIGDVTSGYLDGAASPEIVGAKYDGERLTLIVHAVEDPDKMAALFQASQYRDVIYSSTKTEVCSFLYTLSGTAQLTRYESTFEEPVIFDITYGVIGIKYLRPGEA